jgi:hypothetical protein
MDGHQNKPTRRIMAFDGKLLNLRETQDLDKFVHQISFLEIVFFPRTIDSRKDIRGLAYLIQKSGLEQVVSLLGILQSSFGVSQSGNIEGYTVLCKAASDILRYS